MTETINAGTILIKEGAAFPAGLTFESESHSPGWRSVKGLDGFAMDRKTHEAGWTFFYLAGECKTTVLGKEGQETVRKAIKQVLAGLKSEHFNSIEITNVVFKHLLGVPYATVSFHLRNLQESMFLLGSNNPDPWENTSTSAVAP